MRTFAANSASPCQRSRLIGGPLGDTDVEVENGRPVGASWLTPYFSVADAEASLAFFQRASDLIPGASLPGSDGRVVHAGINSQGPAW